MPFDRRPPEPPAPRDHLARLRESLAAHGAASPSLDEAERLLDAARRGLAQRPELKKDERET